MVDFALGKKFVEMSSQFLFEGLDIGNLGLFCERQFQNSDNTTSLSERDTAILYSRIRNS
jgi:hypothetical protein